MGFDLIILIITAIALLARHSARTDLWKLLFQDGLVYFILSFSTNCIPAVRFHLRYLFLPLNSRIRQVLNVLDLNSENLSIYRACGVD